MTGVGVPRGDVLGALERVGVLSALDRHFAEALRRIAGVTDEAVLLGAAFASRAVQNGNVCADLNRLHATPLIGNDGAPVEGVELGATAALPVLPALPAWREALARSPLVTVVGGGVESEGGIEVEGEGDGATAVGDEHDAPRPLVLAAPARLYLYRYWRYERRLVARLRARLGLAAGVDVAVLRGGLDRLFPPGAGTEPDLQRRAAAAAVLRQLCVITGGPGTGKTSTAAKVLALLQEQARAAGRPLRIALLAPTGKAAQRLGEAIARQRDALPCEPDVRAAIPVEAATIHRALRFDPARPTAFYHGAARPLPADVVLVDEASMVDIALISKLASAVRDDARLVLMGDADQLASVEAGAILGDLCGEGAGAAYSAAFARALEQAAGDGPVPAVEGAAPEIRDCVVHLRRSWRWSEQSAIGRLARAIQAGDAAQALAVLREGWPDVDLVAASDPGELGARLRPAVVAAFAGLGRGTPREQLAVLARFRVLCAHRAGRFGVTRWNELVRDLLAGAGELSVDGEWYVGRPILVTRNDDQIGLYNGDLGVVGVAGVAGAGGERAEDEGEDEGEGDREVFFAGAQGEPRGVSLARLPPHETAFAMTVHKSQGSEFDEVALVLPDRPSPVVTRELLYTAVTRARRRVMVYGGEDVLRDAIARRVERTSGLRAALGG